MTPSRFYKFVISFKVFFSIIIGSKIYKGASYNIKVNYFETLVFPQAPMIVSMVGGLPLKWPNCLPAFCFRFRYTTVTITHANMTTRAAKSTMIQASPLVVDEYALAGYAGSMMIGIGALYGPYPFLVYAWTLAVKLPPTVKLSRIIVVDEFSNSCTAAFVALLFFTCIYTGGKKKTRRRLMFIIRKWAQLLCCIGSK